MPKKRQQGDGSAFKVNTRAAWRRPPHQARVMVMDRDTRHELRCDTCLTDFTEDETIWVAKDGTHHCQLCGSWRGLKPERLNGAMTKNRSLRIRERFGKKRVR